MAVRRARIVQRLSGRPAAISKSRTSSIRLITLGRKQTGKPTAGNLHGGFDVAGIGNGLTVRLVRHSQRKRGAMDRPEPTEHRASPRPYRPTAVCWAMECEF